MRLIKGMLYTMILSFIITLLCIIAAKIYPDTKWQFVIANIIVSVLVGVYCALKHK